MIKTFEKYWFIVLVIFFKINILGFIFFTESLETEYFLKYAYQIKAEELRSKLNLFDTLFNAVLILDAGIVLFLIYYGIKKSLNN